MQIAVDKCLDDLSRRIDERQEQANLTEWISFLNDGWREETFSPTPRKAAPPQVHWPQVSVNEAIADFDSMLLQQFKTCSDVLGAGGTNRLCVRCNYGTAILPSLFGCETFSLSDEANTLPTSRSLGGRDRIRAAVDAGVPDIRGGIGGRVFETAQRFGEVFDKYPVIARNVALYHPDVQGPIDAAEVIWGSDMFYAFYDDPDLLRRLMELVTETYIAFMRRWYELVPPGGEYSTHWGFLHSGRLVIRNDSLMNLSPEIYTDYVRPLDQRIFDEFGGAGVIHFCGRGDHYIEQMSQMRGLAGINMSEPHLNDMQAIYRNTVDKGIKILGLDRQAAETAGRSLRGQVHVCDASGQTFSHRLPT